MPHTYQLCGANVADDVPSIQPSMRKISRHRSLTKQVGSLLQLALFISFDSLSIVLERQELFISAFELKVTKPIVKTHEENHRFLEVSRV